MDIFTTSMNRIFLSTKQDGTFHGACIDTGAQSLVIGKKNAKAYLKKLGLRLSQSIIREDTVLVMKHSMV